MARPKKEVPSEFKTEDGIAFFSEVDLNKNGEIASSFPASYNTGMIEKMDEDISKMESSIKHGLVSEKNKPALLLRIKEMRTRRDSILESTPKLSDANKDRLYGVYKELSGKIGDAMFTRSDMKRGTANAHEEARRMTDPCITLDKKTLELAKAANVRISGDRVSRTGASKLWKFIGKRLGEATNTEVLRRD
jgi:hypothetical protein